MRVELVPYHRDCGNPLVNGSCVLCGYIPETQSVLLKYHCPVCNVELDGMKCPVCNNIFEKQN
jgi:hypothetical protein